MCYNSLNKKNICEQCCMPCCYNRTHDKKECPEFSPYEKLQSLKKIKKAFKKFLKSFMSRKYHLSRKDKYRILKVSIWVSLSALMCFLSLFLLPIKSVYCIVILPIINIILFTFYCFIEGTVD